MSTYCVPIPEIPSVQIFVRHSDDCPYKDDETHRKCKCRKHLRWSYGGKQMRTSAKTRSWAEAEARRHEVEAAFRAMKMGATSDAPAGGVAVQTVSRPTLQKAIELFLSDKRSQGLSEHFVSRYELELGRMREFISRRGIFFPNEITLESLTEFRATWNVLYPSSVTRQKVQERLRAFLRYAHNARMIDRVPKLSTIKVEGPPTMPLTDEEYQTLLTKIAETFIPVKAKRIRALIQLMRHSGLAISDAATLEQSELIHDKKKGLYRIETSRTKTGTHVSVPIQAEVAKELLAVGKVNANKKYFFWSGNGKVKTILSDFGNDIRKVFRLAGLSEGGAHRLRDSFAVGLLSQGVPIEEVSKLLGHSSIKVTERSYAPWVKSRQDRLDSLVTATWA